MMKHVRWLALLIALSLLLGMMPIGYAETTDDADNNNANATPAMSTSLEEAGMPLEDAAAAVGVASQPFIPEDAAEKAIIGLDNRVTIDNPSVYPYSAIAYLVVKARCGCDWTATGFMVGPDAMMTASHCVVCSDHGQTANEITAYFGYVSSKNYRYKYTKGTHYWYGTNFSNGDGTYGYNGHLDWDYAYIKLQERVGDTVGWFGLYAKSDSELELSGFELAGYRRGELKASWGVTNVYNDYRISYNNDTLAGNSGCPVFTDDYYVVAINIAERLDGSKNWGRRITGTLIKEMRENNVID